RWRVFRVEYHPSDRAVAEAGELQGRDVLPLSWAVPMRTRSARGEFWAYFPTDYVTTLSGILNAPWKLTEDRKSLLDTVLNRELLEEASELIVQNLPKLVNKSDPGAIIDIMPARGEEAPNWADRAITELGYEKARS